MNMGTLIDLTGQRFGLLTVVGKAETTYDECGTSRVNWMVKCDCGDMDVTKARYLSRGTKTNCGKKLCKEKEFRYKNPRWETDYNANGFKIRRINSSR
jgi:hypothetical protein